MTDESLQLGDAEVVLAVAVGASTADDRRMRPYQTWVRGPATDHTNAEMVQLLAMLATTMVIGNAMHGKISVQASIDNCREIFGRSLEAHVHRIIASGAHHDNLRTVDVQR